MRAAIILFLLIVLSYSVSAYSIEACHRYFFRGDANNDYRLDLTDSIFILNSLFLGDTLPECLENGDINEDERIDIADPIYLLNYLFTGGPAPVNPTGEGIDDPPKLGAVLFDEGSDNIPLENIEIPGIIMIFDEHSEEGDIINCLASYEKVDEDNAPIEQEKILYEHSWIDGQSLAEGYPIIITEEHFNPEQRYGINVKCKDKKNQEGELFFIIIPHKRTDVESLPALLGAPPPPDIPGDNPPISTLTACCEVDCGGGKKVCINTIEADCNSCNPNPTWRERGYKYDTPSALCQAYFPTSACTYVKFDKDKTCNEESNPPVCEEDCSVERMTILYRNTESAPAEMQFPSVFLRQTTGTAQSLGHVEGWMPITTAKEREMVTDEKNIMYDISWRFVVYAEVKGNPEHCSHGQFEKDLLITEEINRNTGVFIRKPKSKHFPNFMHDENDILFKKKLKDVKQATAKEAIFDKLIRVRLGDKTTCHLASRFGVPTESNFFCGDDYSKDAAKFSILKYIKGEKNKIIWRDHEFLVIHKDEFAFSFLYKDNKYTNEDIMSADLGHVKSFKSMDKSITAIIEDSNALFRNVCILKFGLERIFSNALSRNQKARASPEPSCICFYQEWVNNQWKKDDTVPEKKCENIRIN